jgi:hypothetical protein
MATKSTKVAKWRLFNGQTVERSKAGLRGSWRRNLPDPPSTVMAGFFSRGRIGGMEYRCVNCRSNNLCNGKLAADAGLSFRPDSTSFLRLSFGVRVKAVACLDCGITVLSMDPEELRDFSDKPQQKIQFSLRILLLIMTLFAIGLGLVAILIARR